MPIEIKRFEVGPVITNCYIVYNERSSECIIIDPGAEPEKILGFISDNKLNPKYIINTHGHPDHIGANKEIKKTYPGVPICVHRDDAMLLTEKQAVLTVFFGMKYGSPPADRLLEEGDELEITDLKLRVIHTPGHTPGGISLLDDKFIFTGDLIFYDSVGRSDLPGGNAEELIDSIKKKILVLDGKITIYPGHGIHTTIEREHAENPFL